MKLHESLVVFELQMEVAELPYSPYFAVSKFKMESNKPTTGDGQKGRRSEAGSSRPLNVAI